MKRKIKVEAWRLVVAILCFILMGILIGQIIPLKISEIERFFQPVNIAYASGTDNVTLNCEADNMKTSTFHYTNALWSNGVSADNATDTTGTGQNVGWQCGPVENRYSYFFRNIYGWDLSGYEDVEVVEAYIELWLQRYKTYVVPPNPYFGLYKTRAGSPVTDGDYNSAYAEHAKMNLTDYVRFEDVDTNYEWVRFNLLESRFEHFFDPDENNLVWVTLASMNDMTTNAPFWEANSTMRLDGTYTMGKLTIRYLQDTPDRVVVTEENAAVDNTTTGFEVADNITWGSPRLGYSDEGIYLIVNGESGTVIDLKLVDGYGAVLDSVTDSIRVDGNYDYTVDLPDNWYGYVRLHELENGIYSVWGYQYPVPDTSQVGNTVYAVDTAHPQYDYLFTRYLKSGNEIMAIHWKTNVQPDELDSHYFEIWSNSDNDSPEYSQTLDWLNTNYFMASDNNASLAGWRYMLMTPDILGTGFEDYDGLFINLDSTYSAVTSGFLQAVVTDNGTLLANSHSCYWYLASEKDGLIMITDKSDYESGEKLIVKVQVGSASKVSVNLPSLVLQILDNSGAVVNTAYVTVYEGLNEMHWEAPVIPGNYEMRFTFSGDGSWSYIHDRPFTVEGGEDLEPGGQLLDNIKAWIADVGMDNPAGYWLITLIGMVILFLICYKSSVMRVALPLVFLGAMMIFEFIDKWLIILLALGAGLTIFGIFRKKTHGGGEE